MNQFARCIASSTSMTKLIINNHNIYPTLQLKYLPSNVIRLRRLNKVYSFSIRYSSSADSLKCCKCGTKLHSHSSLFCPSSSCSKIQKLDPRKCNIYELFNLGPMNYDVDMSLVDANYRNLQKLVHPDKFSVSKSSTTSAPTSNGIVNNGSSVENSNSKHTDKDDRSISLENSAFINHANHVLKSPVERAFYIVSIPCTATYCDCSVLWVLILRV